MKQKNLLQELKTANLTNEEKGKIQLNLALSYLKTINDINLRYMEILENIIEALETINKKLNNQI